MASKDRKTRCREVAGILLLFLFLNAKRIRGQNEESAASSDDVLQQREWAIMDRLIQAYGSTNWSAVAGFLVSNPEYQGNPNIVFIPLSLGNAYLNRYEWRNDIADFERSLEWFEWVAGTHWL